ncbi:MAG TPA: DUF5110 domain-containing protein, partial [Bryobacteraceae bacterium]|nr:DUF5110 domain-containing protein [Bryobacteraceae bacterium]
SFRYQQGEFTEITCAWQDSSRTLTLAWAAGSKPAPGKTVRIRAVDKDQIREVKLATHPTTVHL